MGDFAILVGSMYAGIGVLLLVDTILRYGPLYRREALAVTLSFVPPMVGLFFWLFRLGPAPMVNFTPVLFLPHALLDAYAFTGPDMFESNPTTLRAAEDAAYEAIESPVVTLDEEGRVLDYNDETAAVLAVDPDDAVGTPLAEAVGAALTVDADAGDQYVTLANGGRAREYRVRIAELTGPLGSVVGATAVFQDVTREREREQRLAVLNRVLRHNLRNEMTVIGGHAERVRAESTQDAVVDSAATIERSSRKLTDIGERAREFDGLRERDPAFEPVDLSALVADVVGESRARDAVSVAGEDGVVVSSDPVFLRTAVRTLVETVADRTDGQPAEVTVERGPDGTARIALTAPAETLPATEVEPVVAGEEDALNHGSGIGLWVVKWSVAAVGGEFGLAGDGATTVTVTLPSTAS
ncbi:MAG: histidine kinase N-terminal 7TM domain-containing protein [Haloarculaceae archaeon]